MDLAAFSRLHGEFYVAAENITDEDYGFLSGYPMPGTTYTSGLKLKFQVLMKNRELSYCGLFGAAALLLPVLFHLVHLGHIFMPMYLPLVTLAFFVRPGISAMTALIVPLMSGAATGMPPFYPPVAPVMSLELALMTIIIGVLRSLSPHAPVLIVLVPVLVVGRVAGAGLMYLAALSMGLPATFIAGISFLSGWPGIILMIVVIPAIVRLSKDRLHTTQERKPDEK